MTVVLTVRRWRCRAVVWGLTLVPPDPVGIAPLVNIHEVNTSLRSHVYSVVGARSDSVFQSSNEVLDGHRRILEHCSVLPYLPSSSR